MQQNQISLEMERYQTENCSFLIVEQIMGRVEEEVQRRKLLTRMPMFLAGEVGRLIGENMGAVARHADRKLGMEEEVIDNVPRLQKDTLMPKDVSEQKVKPQSPDCLSPRSTSSVRKSLKFSKKQSNGLTSKLKSISMSEKKSSLGKTNMNKTCMLANYEPQNSEDDEIEKEIVPLREKAEYRFKFLEEEMMLKKKREENFKEKLQNYNQTIEGNPDNDVTFDFDGDPLAATITEGKMKLNSMKAGMGPAARKLKDGFNKINAETHKIQVARRHQFQKADISRNIRNQELPLFPMKTADPKNFKTLKLQEYRRNYGKRYSRMGQTMPVVERAKTSRDDLFAQKKHLKEPQAETIEHHPQQHEGNHRRLALPKLHGKYKVLDRYEQN